jgi:transposase
MDEILDKRIEKERQKLIEQRKKEEAAFMGRMNRQLNLAKMVKQRDERLLDEGIEEIVEEETYTVKIDEDGDIEIEEKE